jgi:hypothetical protein
MVEVGTQEKTEHFSVLSFHFLPVGVWHRLLRKEGLSKVALSHPKPPLPEMSELSFIASRSGPSETADSTLRKVLFGGRWQDHEEHQSVLYREGTRRVAGKAFNASRLNNGKLLVEAQNDKQAGFSWNRLSLDHIPCT